MNRRQFVVKGSMASLAVASSTSIFGNLNLQNANNKINIGIIGTGRRGGGLVPFIEQIKNLNIAACCDVLPFRLKKGLLAINTKAKGYSHYQDLLNNKDIDAVIIATPFSTHSQLAIDALDAGKHVYVEKTMAKGYDGIQDLVSKAKSSKDSVFQTGHQYHSSRLYTEVVQMITNGKIGKISAIDCQWNQNGNWRRPVQDPELEKAINWRMYKEFSGGLVAELCSHQIDFANWVLNSTPEIVVGMGGIDYWKDGRETYDNIHLIYSYSNGVKATFTCLTSNSKDDYQIKVLGDKGTIILDHVNAWFYPEGSYKKETGIVDGVSGATIPWDPGKGIPLEVEHADPSKQALVDFRDSIMNNKNPASNVITGAETAISVQMGLDALHYEKIVKWRPEFTYG